MRGLDATLCALIVIMRLLSDLINTFETVALPSGKKQLATITE